MIKLTFKKYAKYYDVLYADKDYQSECEEIIKLIQEYSVYPEILMVDLGCGLGTHMSIFNDMGYFIEGIDKSADMIKLAKKRHPELEVSVGDVTNFELETKANVAMSLFHVVSYLTTDEEIDNFLDSVYENTSDEALLIFDVWCGHGVIADVPEERTKLIDKNTYRKATPTINLEEQTVGVKYNIYHNNKERMEELHTMRYFFPREIKKMLNDKGFELLTTNPKKTKVDTWSMLIVCKKK